MSLSNFAVSKRQRYWIFVCTFTTLEYSSVFCDYQKLPIYDYAADRTLIGNYYDNQSLKSFGSSFSSARICKDLLDFSILIDHFIQFPSLLMSWVTIADCDVIDLRNGEFFLVFAVCN